MLKISNVSFAYQNQEVLSQVNLILPSRGRVSVIGDNGTGKSTLLKLLAGQLRPDDGSIKVDGKIGWLPQAGEIDDQSGGERTRHNLERLFAMNYDALLLDEPTNNLDEEGINWLVSQLLRYDGLAVVVSHDRDFIGQVAERIVEVKDGKLLDYAGDYASYQLWQEQLKNEALTRYQNEEKAKAALKRQIVSARNRLNSKNRHFDKMKDENRMVFRTKRNHAEATAGKLIRDAKNKLGQLATERPEQRKVYQSNILADVSRRRRLLLVDGVTKSYGEKKVLDGVSFEIYTGERCRVMGKNGAGKTTLFGIIMGDLRLDDGTIWLAENMTIGYIAQDRFGLDLTRSFVSQVEANRTEIFRAAVTLDLTVNDLNKPLEQVSRGQLTKMAFLKIMLAPVDLLILDEPTNHLDIRARENIERALEKYAGAILFATHDGAFAKSLGAGKVVELD